MRRDTLLSTNHGCSLPMNDVALNHFQWTLACASGYRVRQSRGCHRFSNDHRRAICLDRSRKRSSSLFRERNCIGAILIVCGGLSLSKTQFVCKFAQMNCFLSGGGEGNNFALSSTECDKGGRVDLQLTAPLLMMKT